METRKRNSRFAQKTEWLLVKNGEKEERREEDVHVPPSYSSYPTPERFPDKLPPDYPAILSLLFSVISICWNVVLSPHGSGVECLLLLALRRAHHVRLVQPEERVPVQPAALPIVHHVLAAPVQSPRLVVARRLQRRPHLSVHF